MAGIRLFLVLLMVALVACEKEEGIPNQVGEWRVTETIRRTEDGVIVHESFTEYILSLHANGRGERNVLGATTRIDWWVHNDNKNIVLVEFHGSGSTIITVAFDFNIEVDERERQVWAERIKFIDLQQKEVEMDEIFELDRIE